MKLSTIFTEIFLLLVSTGHLLRLIFQVKFTINGAEFPMWASIPVVIFTAGLAVWLFIENKKQEKQNG